MTPLNHTGKGFWEPILAGRLLSSSNFPNDELQKAKNYKVNTDMGVFRVHASQVEAQKKSLPL